MTDIQENLLKSLKRTAGKRLAIVLADLMITAHKEYCIIILGEVIAKAYATIVLSSESLHGLNAYKRLISELKNQIKTTKV